jgi:signal transduction histidine kinase
MAAPDPARALYSRIDGISLLVDDLTHALNNQMLAIVGSAGLLRLQSDQNPDLIKRLDTIKNSVDQSNKLIREIRTKAFVRAGSKEACDLGGIASTVAEDHPEWANVIVQSGAGESTVPGESRELYFIVESLIANAIEASRNDEPIVVRLTKSTFPADGGDCVCLTVEDRGTGMSAQTQEKMFDPFFSMKGDGRGYGLAMLHRLVAAKGRTVDVASEPDRGTTMTLRFPIAA